MDQILDWRIITRSDGMFRAEIFDCTTTKNVATLQPIATYVEAAMWAKEQIYFLEHAQQGA